VDVDVDGAGQQQGVAVIGPGARIRVADVGDAAVGDGQTGTLAAAARRQNRPGNLLDD
jgi:hypothetical protein